MIQAAQTHAKPSSNRCRESTSTVKRGGPSVAGQQALSRLAFGPRLRRLKALTGLAARPSLATKRSTVGSG
jgi:hypothetical protein